jgi:hypothetical protein
LFAHLQQRGKMRFGINHLNGSFRDIIAIEMSSGRDTPVLTPSFRIGQ